MSSSNRRQPTRSVRTSAIRPSNYYARPYGFPGASTVPAEHNTSDITTPGFFPAITHFTDAVAALPKEVMRHFTLLRETEGKAYAPDQAIAEIVSAINKLPEPPKQHSHPHTHPYLGFSLTNSVNGSANVSMIDGHFPPRSRPDIADLSAHSQSLDTYAETRRTLFRHLRDRLKETIGVLDEKTMVLTSANETLSRQLARMENTLPFVEAEVSEDARLGSNTHWALPHMKESRKANGIQANDRSRRDVQAANNLAAAAAVVGESDLAASRSEARREALQAKRKHHNVDSDFDDRPGPRRVQNTTKIRKVQETNATVVTDTKGSTGAAPPNQSHKRRRVDKPTALPMERLPSAVANGRAAIAKDTGGSSRETPVVDGGRKKAKPPPVPAVARKRNPANSPSIVSSPTRGTFATTTTRDYSPAPSNQRTTAPRGRQNSNQSVRSIIHDRVRNTTSAVASGKVSTTIKATTPDIKAAADMTGRTLLETRAAITDSYNNAYGERTIEEEGVAGAIVVNFNESKPMSSLKQEESEFVDDAPAVVPQPEPAAVAAVPAPALAPTPGQSVPMTVTRSRNGSSKNSKPATPVNSVPEGLTAAPLLSRSRSTRGINATHGPLPAAASSPPVAASIGSPRRSHKRGANTHLHDIGSPTRSSASSNDARASTQALPSAIPVSIPRTGHSSSPPSVASSADEAGPDGPSSPASDDEPRYCVCGQVSYGDMIACDNENCPREWFHLQCVGLTKAPGSKAKWYCDECKEVLRRGGRAVV